MSKLIFTSLSPNAELDDLALVWKVLFSPRSWHRAENVKELEKKFADGLGVKYAITFNSGRSAFLAILKGLALPAGSEILIQGFTCNAVVNPILWSGLKPVYVDIQEDTLNIDPADLEKKITSKSRAVVVQHAFGLPADIGRIQDICQKHNLILIEDCAHSLGANYKGKLVGTFGQASFFSFGRDKVISSVYGGLAVTNDSQLAEKIRVFQEGLKSPSKCWILQQLLHPLLTHYLVMPLYSCGELGRFLLLFLQRIGVVSKAVHKLEKQGRQPKYIPQKMPGALAKLALNQLAKLEKFNQHRQVIAGIYENNLKKMQNIKLPQNSKGRIYWRYPVLVSDVDTDEVIKKARREKIFLDDGWRKALVVPPDTDQKAMGYIKGSCPAAEKTADSIVNLPTHINIAKEDAMRTVRFLKFCLENG